MAGFLETLFGSPDQTMALGLLGANMMAGNAPQGFLAAQQHLAGAEDRKLKRGLLEMQAENYRSEIEQRKAAIQKQQRIQDAVAGLLGGSQAAPAAPGQMGSGSFGIVPAPAGQTDMPQPRGGLSAASLEQIAGLHALGGPNLMDAYKFARQGIERKPGSFYENMQGRREFIPNVEKGLDYRNGTISPIPGYTDFLSAQTRATEGPKAEIAAQYALEKVYNPATQREELVPRSRVLGTQPQQPAQRPQASAGQLTAQPGVRGDFVGDPAQVMEAISQIRDPQERANAMAAFQEQARRTSGFAEGGGFAAGPSAGEAAAAAGAKTQAEAEGRIAAERTGERTKRTEKATDMVSMIERARVLLGQDPTASMTGAGVDWLLSVPGMSTKSGDVAAALDNVSGWLVANVPRMEGPQSNFDVQNYQTMAGMIGNRQIPVSQRLAALTEVERIQRKYAGLNQNEPPKQPPTHNGGGKLTPQEQQELEALRKQFGRK